MDKSWKILLYAIIAMLAGFLVLNSPYIGKQIQYYFGQTSSFEPDESVSELLVDPNILQIPSLGIKTPVIYVDETNEKIYQEALKSGVVHFPGTALPGEYGNPYIFGHSSDYAFAKGNYKTVFALLPKIELGASIYISDPEGRQFKYLVEKSFVTDPDDLTVLDQYDYESKKLTLQTSYPIGTALRRWIVVARIVE